MPPLQAEEAKLVSQQHKEAASQNIKLRASLAEHVLAQQRDLDVFAKRAQVRNWVAGGGCG